MLYYRRLFRLASKGLYLYQNNSWQLESKQTGHLGIKAGILEYPNFKEFLHMSGTEYRIQLIGLPGVIRPKSGSH